MLIGIDIGGTYTDGVVYREGKIIKTAKKPTLYEEIDVSLLAVLDDLIKDMDVKQVKRLVISTTLVTNLIATGRGERTALLLLPGYGLPHDLYRIGDDTYFLKGSIDFRGREIEEIDEKEVIECIEDIKKKGIRRVAIAGKFASRNNLQEKKVQDLFHKHYREALTVISSKVANRLNFPRRAATAYFTAMTLKEWEGFVAQIRSALQERNLSCEVFILKADGGTTPLDLSVFTPCETVFSGPAASTMGGKAITMDDKNAVVIDIGGTTSDISLLIEGNPLYASKGAVISGFYTHIHALAVKSVPLGGDSLIYLQDGSIDVAPYREGNAACLGGNRPTVTDVFNVKYRLNVGNAASSVKALQELALLAGMELDRLCDKVVDIVISRLTEAIKNMFKEWENEPAYKVWEVVNGRRFKPDRLIGIGAAARAIIPVLAEKMDLPYLVHDHSPVANALGAAVARPTLTVNLHIDTAQGVCMVDPGGIRQQVPRSPAFSMEEARKIALNFLQEIGKKRGMEDYLEDYRFYKEEQFNMIRGWDRIGKIFEIELQVAPGFIKEYRGVI
ncbi:N-methylhydantoinase A/oxoprolinase/acetone carboxylase, beta subunit [Thermosyntropha lipolytica DSM 11003]|uniref:N-methylhydantoinase A/oxoprolinase/acetone carboxylase, beta subunit n=1 Tax=Thermosyntropha lipolytica DSM 11003 TaxID=1123382 RepID=A0A1M5PLG1_9FIRM|nr:hydantoinase/oxoprolinase family protein [Thermosyntropha lipolytica]SHH02614.1 N-methylhydantoinase A/oxoprolinase/acetone carboxylase, beta subunit [Thermosyntropha lipolytica DSM 11003]